VAQRVQPCMPARPTPYRINPLPQAEAPQCPSEPVPLVESPENLYKPEKMNPQGLPRRPKPESTIRETSPIQSSEPTRAYRNHQRPEQSPALTQRQQVEALEIAQRVQDTSQSSRLEHLLRRQASKRYQSSQRPLVELEQLTIVRRPDRGYQIVLSFNQQAVTHQVFRTFKHCAEAAAELEQRFELSIVSDGATAEAMQAIVRAAATREQVELECAVA
jgi:hypothetical protein